MNGCDAVHNGIKVVDDPRGGFVLALVVLLLFGIGVAGTAGYQVVFGEALLSVHAKETQTALSIARAGLRSYIGKQIGVHEDIVTYSIEGGDAVVSARLLVEDDFESLYLLSSEGVYTDPTFTGSAARRTVYQYARKREVAVDHIAAVTQVSGGQNVASGGYIGGLDRAGAGECVQAQTDIIGVVMGSGTSVAPGSRLDGSSDLLSLGTMAAAEAALGIDWAVLSSSSFPVDYEDVWPSCALPADSFTVTRFNGYVAAPAGACGQGVLIVKNGIDPANGFVWNGIILAGHVESTTNDFTINGLVVSGLDGTSQYTHYYGGSYVYYNRCHAFQAGKRLSHFEAVGSTWWEEM